MNVSVSLNELGELMIQWLKKSPPVLPRLTTCLEINTYKQSDSSDKSASAVNLLYQHFWNWN